MAKTKTKKNPVAVIEVDEELTPAQREKRFKEKFKGAVEAAQYSKKRNLGHLAFDEAIRAERERR